jgi:Mlc titration factor MtfA (ptsG expression regulator)
MESFPSVSLILAVFAVLLGAIALAANRWEKAQSRRRSPDSVRLSAVQHWLIALRHLPDPLDFLRRRRRRRVRAAPFPAEWRDVLLRHVSLYGKLPTEYQRELEGHVQVLLAEKVFEGCDGLTLTDDIRVTIAGHAALLLVGTPDPRYYPDLKSVLVYPSSYFAPVEEAHGGIVTERQEGRLGESWQRGVVVLAWDAARAGAHDPRDGDNVIVHEFAHQLDTEDGVADGVPYLDSPSDYIAWARALAPEYERLRAQPHGGVLDAYGATDPAEFFAVATEAFFEKPHQLQTHNAALYSELSRFYHLDPATLQPDVGP